jgi:hypothetical protein
LGSGAFVRYREKTPVGALAPAYFEAIAIGTYRVLEQIQRVPEDLVREKIIEIIQTPSFKENIGPGSGTRTKLANRIRNIEVGLSDLIHHHV